MSPWQVDRVVNKSRRSSLLTTPILGFPKPGSFCKTGFSVLGKVKPGFWVRFWFWKSRHCVHCKSAGGLQAATLLTELLPTLSRRSKRAFNLPPCLPGSH